MWQRKQTVFLVVAIIAAVVCLCCQLASWQPDGLTLDTVLTNYVITDGDNPCSFMALPLAALLVLAVVLAIGAIATFRNRPLQAKLCTGGAVTTVLWYAYYALLVTVLADADGAFSPEVASALPVVALVLFVLARWGVLADEALVRAADRIR